MFKHSSVQNKLTQKTISVLLLNIRIIITYSSLNLIQIENVCEFSTNFQSIQHIYFHWCGSKIGSFFCSMLFAIHTQIQNWFNYSRNTRHFRISFSSILCGKLCFLQIENKKESSSTMLSECSNSKRDA